MKTVMEKAEVLLEAMPYIRDFRGEAVVIKLGGSAMEDKSCFSGILSDTAFMECVGLKPIIVHGGGHAISNRMKKEGLSPTFVKGLRVTDRKTVMLVQEVLNDKVNPTIVKTLESFGARAERIEGVNVLVAEKFEPLDQVTHKPLDLGFVGRVIKVNVEPIQKCLNKSCVPVITPLGRDAEGQIYNINADDAAAAIAMALRARKLVFLSDVPGLLKDPDNPNSVISHLRHEEANALIACKTIDGGMMPKVQSALTALKSGVKKIHIIDGRLRHSLLLEIFTKTGIGTEIVNYE